MDTAININDQRTADAFWTLLKPLKRDLKEQNNPIHTDSLSDAQEFIKTLSVHGEKPVPSNEKGMFL